MKKDFEKIEKFFLDIGKDVSEKIEKELEEIKTIKIYLYLILLILISDIILNLIIK